MVLDSQPGAAEGDQSNPLLADGQQDSRVVIVDQSTGRLLHGSRWQDAMHQFVEAKEGLRVGGWGP